ncbi:hypothetical protein KCU89_g12276, partial [Aureobasidium melanogenum]
LGKLKYVSRRRVTAAAPYHILDWALVAFSNGTFDTERLQNKNLYKVNYRPELTSGAPGISGPVLATVGLEAGMDIWEYGRTTGVTHGKIRMVKVELRVATFWKDQLVYNPGNVISTSERVINNEFCQGGDPGSWVLDANSKLVGLLWGEAPGDCIVTDINTVIKSVLAVKELAGYRSEVLLNV